MDRVHTVLLSFLSLLACHLVHAQSLDVPRPIYAPGPATQMLSVPPRDVPIAGALSYSLLKRFDAVTVVDFEVVAVQVSDGSVAWRKTGLVSLCDFDAQTAYAAESGSIRADNSGNVVVQLANESWSCIIVLEDANGTVAWVKTFDLGPCDGSSLRCRYALGFGASGDLLLFNQARLKRLSMADGALQWDKVPSIPGQRRYGVLAISDGGDGGFVVSFLVHGATSGEPLSLITKAYSEQSGLEQWSIETPLTTWDENSVRADLRKLPAGHVIELLQAPASATISGFVRRLGATGGELWRSDLSSLGMLGWSELISFDGGVVLDGGVVGGTQRNLVVVNLADGTARWSMPLGLWSKAVVAGSQLHVLRGVPDEVMFPTSAVLSSRALDDGAESMSMPVRLSPEGIHGENARLSTIDGGDLLLTSISGPSPSLWYPNDLLHLARLVPTTGQTWSSDHSIPGRLAINVPALGMQNDRIILDDVVGARFAYVAGFTPILDLLDNPRLHKIDVTNAGLVWAWQGAPGTAWIGPVEHAMDGDLIVASSNSTGSVVLSKIAEQTGFARWSTSAASGSVPRVVSTPTGETLMLRRGDGHGGGEVVLSTHAQATGQVLWSIEVPAPSDEQAALQRLADGHLAFTAGRSPDGHTGLRLYKRSHADGAALWDVTLSDTAPSAPARILAFASGDALVVSGAGAWRVDGATGAIRWRQDLTFDIRSALIGDADDVYVGGAWTTRLDPTTGMRMWETPLSAGLDTVSAIASSTRSSIFAGGGEDSVWVCEIDRATGSVRWRVDSAESRARSVAAASPVGNFYGGPHFIAEAGNGDVLFAGQAGLFEKTFTVFNVTGTRPDGIFADGFE